jgi:NAD(P)-dependent dehydrogenase (short-subunit alcohol dehydrogenase family)
MTSKPFQNKTVLVTGAARGIGAGVVRRMHAAGANVALVGLEPERMTQLADELGSRAAVYEADVTDIDALTNAAEATAAQFGGIDVAVANAGVAFVGALSSAPVEHIDRTLEVNLMGVWRTDRAVLSHLKASRGYLLNITSLAAVGHLPLMGAYTASKAGAEALTDALRMELRPDGVAVGCAYFGFIDTDLVRGAVTANPAGAAAYGLAPSFLSNSIPVEKAVDAIEDAIRRRAERVWAPRFIGPALLTRGILQPIVELGVKLRRGGLDRALALAEDQSSLHGQDPRLGCSAAPGAV